MIFIATFILELFSLEFVSNLDGKKLSIYIYAVKLSAGYICIYDFTLSYVMRKGALPPLTRFQLTAQEALTLALY